MYDVFSLKDFTFPDNFIWGSSYAGHQVEGNNKFNQWWDREQEGKTEQKSGMACNSYELYETDARLVQELSHQAFRTSVEWCRIEPHMGEFNAEAAEHYIRFFASLKEKGIKVFATLVHFTHPSWFEKIGHFKKRENLSYFERYLEYIVPKIAPYVDIWNVMNEFNMGNDEDRINSKTNSVVFHALGYRVIKKYSKAPVSSAHALVQYMPYRPYDEWDNMLAKLFDMRDNEYFFHAIRTGEIIYPGRDVIVAPEVKDTVDYWSINSYTRDMVDCRRARGNGDKYIHKNLDIIGRKFFANEMYPECMIANLDRLRDKAVFISENGCACHNDDFRIVYLSLYLSAIYEAIKMGVNVIGYMHWSLLDNFEWGSYVPTFGLCSVDSKTFKRTPKNSAYFYKEIIENNGFSQGILRRYLKKLPTLDNHDNNS